MDVEVLGPLRVGHDGRVLTLPGRKPRSVLAMLVLAAPHPVSVAALVDALWGDAPVPGARKTLQVHVSQLRAALGPDGGRLVRTTAPGYAFVPDDDDALDLARFEALRRAGRERAAAGDAPGAADAFAAAIGLWRGDPIADLQGAPFWERLVRPLQERRLETIEQWADACIAAGRAADPLIELDAAVAANPLREGLVLRLATALQGSGRRPDALRVLDALRERLATELAVEPGAAIVRLETELRRAAPAGTHATDGASTGGGDRDPGDGLPGIGTVVALRIEAGPPVGSLLGASWVVEQRLREEQTCEQIMLRSGWRAMRLDGLVLAVDAEPGAAARAAALVQRLATESLLRPSASRRIAAATGWVDQEEPYGGALAGEAVRLVGAADDAAPRLCPVTLCALGIDDVRGGGPSACGVDVDGHPVGEVVPPPRQFLRFGAELLALDRHRRRRAEVVALLGPGFPAPLLPAVDRAVSSPAPDGLLARLADPSAAQHAVARAVVISSMPEQRRRATAERAVAVLRSHRRPAHEAALVLEADVLQRSAAVDEADPELALAAATALARAAWVRHGYGEAAAAGLLLARAVTVLALARTPQAAAARVLALLGSAAEAVELEVVIGAGPRLPSPVRPARATIDRSRAHALLVAAEARSAGAGDGFRVALARAALGAVSPPEASAQHETAGARLIDRVLRAAPDGNGPAVAPWNAAPA